MNYSLPKGAVTKLSPHLYYKKFPFKLEVKKIIHYGYGYAYGGSYSKERKAVIAFFQKLYDLLPKNKELVRTRQDFYTLSIFFAESADLESFLKAAKTLVNKDAKVTLYAMTEDQAEASKLDAKIEYRKSLYHDAFTYRLQIRGGDDDTLDALEAQFFSDEEIDGFNKRLEALNDQQMNRTYRRKIERYGRQIIGTRARMQYGRSYSSTIVYLKEEDDAAMARLILPSQTKITKAVIVE